MSIVIAILMVLMLFAFHHPIFGCIAACALGVYFYYAWVEYRRIYDPDWRWGGGDGPF